MPKIPATATYAPSERRPTSKRGTVNAPAAPLDFEEDGPDVTVPVPAAPA
jgi:hypothetical protein